MPQTTTATWPNLVSGAKAKASEVEAKFDWLEGHLWPQAGGSTTDGAYDLGGSGKSWRAAWLSSINPTTTAGGVAMFTTTVANSSVGFEIAGAKALLIPRLTTAQRTGLTALNGMVVYDTDIGAFYIYEAGAWGTMGQKIGVMPKVTASNATSTTATVLSVSGSGRIHSIILGDGAQQLNVTGISLVVDSVSVAEIVGNTTSAHFGLIRPKFGYAQEVFVGSLTGVDITSAVDSLVSPTTDINFKSQFKVYMWSRNSGSTATVSIIYEKA